MNIQEALEIRHAVRSYTDAEIKKEKIDTLTELIEKINAENNLHIQLFYNEPKCFSGMMAKYGSFKNVKNYIALVGNDDEISEEKCGYYGEELVLKAQSLGLNSCFVAVTYNKSKCKACTNQNEKVHCIISLGYGTTQGIPHKSKSISALSNVSTNSPEWFKDGINAALLAPTALNQQNFFIRLNDDDTVTYECKKGTYTVLDKGIVKYNFEIGSKKENISWK